MFHIGILQLTQNLDDAVRGFKQKLEQFDVPVTYTYRNVDGNIARLAEMAEELADLHVDLIFACSTPAALAAKALTANIPVLFTPVFDPISAGLTTSLTSPDGKVTGMSGMVLAADKVAFIRELLPQTKNICLLLPADDKNAQIEAANFHAAAKGKIEVTDLTLANQSEISLLEEKIPANCDALFLPIGRILEENFSSIAYYADARGIPIIASHAPNVVMGALAALCASHEDLGASCAEQAKQILIDKKSPQEIPVGLPKNPDILLNSFVAENLGIELPVSIVKKAKEIYK